MALNNQNNRQIASVYVGSLATDNTQVPLIHFAKKVRINAIKLINGAAITASDTDYIQPGVQLVGSTVLAEGDSRAAHEGALAKNVGWDLNLVVTEIEAGSDLEFDYQEGGTMALTTAVVQIDFTVL